VATVTISMSSQKDEKNWMLQFTRFLGDRSSKPLMIVRLDLETWIKVKAFPGWSRLKDYAYQPRHNHIPDTN
jgi:hypothetical protein